MIIVKAHIFLGVQKLRRGLVVLVWGYEGNRVEMRRTVQWLGVMFKMWNEHH
jgi:hypothetical protein